MRKQNENEPTPFDVKDPKPPVIHSGHMEDRKQN